MKLPVSSFPLAALLCLVCLTLGRVSSDLGQAEEEDTTESEGPEVTMPFIPGTRVRHTTIGLHPDDFLPIVAFQSSKEGLLRPEVNMNCPAPPPSGSRGCSKYVNQTSGFAFSEAYLAREGLLEGANDRDQNSPLRSHQHIVYSGTCAIVGTGPSAARIRDWSFLRQFSTVIGLNKVGLIAETAGIPLDYWVMMGDAIMQQMADQVLETPCNVVKLIPAAYRHYFPCDASPWNINFVYTRKTGRPPCSRFCYAPHLGLETLDDFSGYAALQLSFFLGCRYVYLFGFDGHEQSGKPGTSQPVSETPSMAANHFPNPYYTFDDRFISVDAEARAEYIRSAKRLFRSDQRHLYFHNDQNLYEMGDHVPFPVIPGLA